MIPERVDSKERPKVVEEKTRLGDWELESIIGAKHAGALTSMVERNTKLPKLVLLPGPPADAPCKGMIKRLKPVTAHVLTLTSANGQECAGHKKIRKKLDAGFSCCTPYHSWERGLHEHTHGLVRQYFPKGMDFATITRADVQRVENLLNNRPRKTLGYRSPNAVFAQLTATHNYALRI